MDIDERFWSKVKLEDEAFPENGCMLWTGVLSAAGYPIFSIRAHPVSAHRWIYERLRGPILNGMQLDHICRVRHCVNPDHVEPVTRKENVRRGKVPAGKTHCIRGHPYTAENLLVTQHGEHRCRECNRIRNRKYNAEKRYDKRSENEAYRIKRHIYPDWIKIRNRKGINSARANWIHCINGHEFTEENTGWNPNGTRYCRVCKRIRVKRYKQEHKNGR